MKTSVVQPSGFKAGRVAYIALMVCFLCLLNVPSAFARTAIVVISRTNATYLEAYRAAKPILESKGFKVRGYPLSAMNKTALKDLSQNQGPVFIAIGSSAASNLHQRLPGNIPLTFCMVGNPEQLKLHQGRRVAGVSFNIPVTSKLKLVQDGLPKVKRIGLLYNSKSRTSVRMKIEVQQAMPAGLELAAVDLTAHASFAAALATLTKQDIDLLWTDLDSSVFNNHTIRAMLLNTIRKGIPVFGFSFGLVRSGAIIGVGVTPRQQGEQVAHLTARMVDDAQWKVGNLHLEPPNFGIAVNLRVANILKQKITPSVIDQADELSK